MRTFCKGLGTKLIALHTKYTELNRWHIACVQYYLQWSLSNSETLSWLAMCLNFRGEKSAYLWLVLYPDPPSNLLFGGRFEFETNFTNCQTTQDTLISKMSFKRGFTVWSRVPISSTVDSTCVSREGEILRGAEDRITYHQTREASWLLLLICPRLFLWIHDVETETPEEGKPHQYWPRQLKSRSQFLHHKVKNFSNGICGQLPYLYS